LPRLREAGNRIQARRAEIMSLDHLKWVLSKIGLSWPLFKK
jgi:hypothetical protein